MDKWETRQSLGLQFVPGPTGPYQKWCSSRLDGHWLVGLLISFLSLIARRTGSPSSRSSRLLCETSNQDRDHTEHQAKNNANHLREHAIKSGKLVKGTSANPKRHGRHNAEEQRRSSE